MTGMDTGHGRKRCSVARRARGCLVVCWLFLGCDLVATWFLLCSHSLFSLLSLVNGICSLSSLSLLHVSLPASLCTQRKQADKKKDTTKAHTRRGGAGTTSAQAAGEMQSQAHKRGRRSGRRKADRRRWRRESDDGGRRVAAGVF